MVAEELRVRETEPWLSMRRAPGVGRRRETFGGFSVRTTSCTRSH